MRRHRVLMGLAAVAVVLAPACSSSDPEVSTGPDDAQEAPAPDLRSPDAVEGAGAASAAFLSQAAQNTVAAPAFDFSMTMDVEGIDGVGSGTVLTAQGTFSQDGRRGQLTMDMSAMLEGLAGEDLGGAGGLLGGLTDPWELVVDGDTTYLRGGVLTSLLGADTEWVAVTGGGVAMDPSSGLADPTRLLESLEGAGDVTEVGTDEIAGALATHYRADIDLDGLAGADLGTGGALAMDVWIDESDQLVRRMQMTMDAAAMGQGGGTVVVTIDLTPLDEAVEIDVPDPSQVTDVEDLGLGAGGLGGLGGGLGG